MSENVKQEFRNHDCLSSSLKLKLSWFTADCIAHLANHTTVRKLHERFFAFIPEDFARLLTDSITFITATLSQRTWRDSENQYWITSNMIHVQYEITVWLKLIEWTGNFQKRYFERYTCRAIATVRPTSIKRRRLRCSAHLLHVRSENLRDPFTMLNSF